MSSFNKKCRVPGCTSCRPGRTHFCKICGDNDSTHRSADCPMANAYNPCAAQGCRVPGCTSCRPGRTHFCKICGDNDSTHRSANCPLGSSSSLGQPIGQLVAASGSNAPSAAVPDSSGVSVFHGTSASRGGISATVAASSAPVKTNHRGAERALDKYKRTHKSQPGKQAAHYFAHEDLKAFAWKGTEKEWQEWDTRNKHVQEFERLRDKYVDHKDNFRYVNRSSNTYDLGARDAGKVDGIHRIVDTDFHTSASFKPGEYMKHPNISWSQYEDRWLQKVKALKQSGGINEPEIYQRIRSVGQAYGFDLRTLNGSGPAKSVPKAAPPKKVGASHDYTLSKDAGLVVGASLSRTSSQQRAPIAKSTGMPDRRYAPSSHHRSSSFGVPIAKSTGMPDRRYAPSSHHRSSSFGVPIAKSTGMPDRRYRQSDP